MEVAVKKNWVIAHCVQWAMCSVNEARPSGVLAPDGTASDYGVPLVGDDCGILDTGTLVVCAASVMKLGATLDTFIMPIPGGAVGTRTAAILNAVCM